MTTKLRAAHSCTWLRAVRSRPHRGQAFAQTYPRGRWRLIVAFVPAARRHAGAADIRGSEAGARRGRRHRRPSRRGRLYRVEPRGIVRAGRRHALLAENALGMSQALYRGKTSSHSAEQRRGRRRCDLAVGADRRDANSRQYGRRARRVLEDRERKMNHASAASAASTLLDFEVFKDAVGIEAVPIPYKGVGAAIADIVAGHVPMTITSVQGPHPGRGRQAQGARGHELDALAGHAARSDHAGSRHEEDRGRGAAGLVRHLRYQGPGGRGEGQARRRVLEVLADQKLRGGCAISTSRREFSPVPHRARLQNERTAGASSWTSKGHQTGIRWRDGLTRQGLNAAARPGRDPARSP